MQTLLRRFTPECCGEEGNAFVEMAIVLPFILIILMASVDLGRALNQYLTITRLVYEGTRIAASIGGLEGGPPHDLTVARSSIAPGHRVIRDRIERLLTLYGLDMSHVTKLESTLIDLGGNRREVRVELDMAFDSLFYQLGFMEELGSAEATGPYLYLGV